MSNLSLKRDFVTHISKLNYAFDKKILKNRPKFLNYASSAILRKSAKKNARLAKLCQKSASTIGKSLMAVVKRRSHWCAQKAWSWVWSNGVVMGVIKGRGHRCAQKAWSWLWSNGVIMG